MDVVCEYDLDEYGRDLDDADEELWQDLLHRLLEDPGSNLDDPDRGVGVVSALSGATSLPLLARRIEADFRKDERVRTVKATVNATGDAIVVEVVTVSGASDGFNVSADAIGRLQ